jgi:aryl-phospho-beta-D-glucosidase BglC (GH1 family)
MTTYLEVVRGITFYAMTMIQIHIKFENSHKITDFLKLNKFNVIRIPFSYEIAINLYSPIEQKYLGDERFENVLDSLEFLFKESGKRDIQILLDFHTINGNINQYPLHNLSEEQFYTAWKNMLNIGIKYDNFIGIDIKNEPHDPTSTVEWALIVNKSIRYIMSCFPTFDGLFFVEGTQAFDHTAVWGGSFKGINNSHPEFMLNDQFIFSPHSYGPSVIGENGNEYDEVYFHEHFGFLIENFDNAVCISETGGTMDTESDVNFFKRLSISV